MSEQPRRTKAAPGTPDAIFEFLGILGQEGELKLDSVKAMINASFQILSVDPGWRELDLRTMDLDKQAALFEEERRGDYSQGSLKNYKSRFLQAVHMYRAWERGDDDWKRYGPGTRGPRVKWTKEQPASSPETLELMTALSPAAVPAIPAQTPTPAPEPPQPQSSVRMMPHTYPLREDVDVQLHLPRDLTTAEANRLAKFIGTLAWEETEAPV